METGGSREHLRRAKKEISMKRTSTVSSWTGSINEQHKTMDQHTSQEFFCIYDCNGQINHPREGGASENGLSEEPTRYIPITHFVYSQINSKG